MSLEFPHPCSHCGLCCISKVCPVGQELMRVTEQGPCCALEWEGDESRCGLLTHPELYVAPEFLPRLNRAVMPEIMGSGVGCCMSARVFMDGKQHDFAALPAEVKTRLVRQIRGKSGH